MSNAQQNLNNNAKHQFGDGKEMTLSQNIDFIKTQEQMTNETKQSSVEYYAKQLEILADKVFKIGLTLDEFRIKKHELLNQAKEMEKEQNKNTWEDSRLEDKGDNYIGKQKSFEDYYNETYGGNK